MARIPREVPMSTTRMLTKKAGELVGDTVGVAKSVLRYGFRTFINYETKELVNMGVEVVAYKALELSAGPAVSSTVRYGSMIAKGVFDPYAIAFSFIQTALLTRILMVALSRFGVSKQTPFVSMLL
jgi:hypothetical protein